MEEERIAQLIAVPNWKSILLDLVEKNEIDPWNVDIVRLTDLYIQRIREMRELDLFVPANAILAASILLFLKSRVLKELREELEEKEEDQEVIDVFVPEEPEEIFLPPLEVKERVVPPSRVVKRGVSLEELLNAMEKLMRKYPRKRRSPEPLTVTVDDLLDRFEEEDVENFVEEVFRRIKELSSDGVVLLSQLSPPDPLSFVKTLLAVLYLATEGKIELFQEEVFGEVIVRVVV